MGEPHPRSHSYPNTFVDRALGRAIKFKFIRDDPKLFLVATISEGARSSEKIVVEFTDKYNTEVHELVAALWHAPRLSYDTVKGVHVWWYTSRGRCLSFHQCLVKGLF